MLGYSWAWPGQGRSMHVPTLEWAMPGSGWDFYNLSHFLTFFCEIHTKRKPEPNRIMFIQIQDNPTRQKGQAHTKAFLNSQGPWTELYPIKGPVGDRPGVRPSSNF